jgi:hypothetical protein
MRVIIPKQEHEGYNSKAGTLLMELKQIIQ